MNGNRFIIITALLLLASLAYASDEFCSLEDASGCNVDDGELTLNPLETDAFIAKAKDEVCAVYFYSETCPHCANVKPLIESLDKKYKGKVHLTKYDVSEPENIQLYNLLCTKNGYTGKKIPLIGINDIILVGENEIKDILEDEILRGIEMDDKKCPLEGHVCHVNANENNGKSDFLIPGLNDLNFGSVLPIIAIAGLGDGINPCAFVILIFVMVFLQQISGSRRRILKITLTYIITIFLTNIVLGMLYFILSIQIGFPDLIRNAIIIVSIIAGLINIKDFFFYGRGVSLGIPKATKKYLHTLVNKASVPSSLVLGVSVAILEAPCSVPIYLAVIEVLKAEGSTISSVFPYILIYNIMFILPLAIIATLVYSGYKAHYLEHMSLKAKKYMKLSIGFILLLLALALLLGWL